MWPTYVQGPMSLTIIRKIEIQYQNKQQTTNIMLFGEEHNSKQCQSLALDVTKTDNGEYVLSTTGNKELWTIGRLLYFVATNTKKSIDYYFEFRFREKIGETGGVNFWPLFHLFEDCVGPSKEKCLFSSRVKMHAIDYRGLFGTRTWATHTLRGDEFHRLAVSFVDNNYELVQDLISYTVWHSFMVNSWNVEDPKTFTTFDPCTPFMEFGTFIGGFSAEFLMRIGKKSEIILSAIISVYQIIYGRAFDIASLVLIYLDYKSDDYIRFIQKMLDNLSLILKPIESAFKMFVFVDTDVKLANDEFKFLLNLVLFQRYYKFICEQILKGNHPSIKRLGGRIVSKAAVQLQKCSRVKMEGIESVEKMLLNWIESKKGQLISGLFWRNWFPAVFTKPHLDRNISIIQDQVILDCLYFMDVPAIARMLYEPSSLKMIYAGDAHRENIQAFFEFCKLSTRYFPAAEGSCLELPEEAKEILNDSIWEKASDFEGGQTFIAGCAQCMSPNPKSLCGLCSQVAYCGQQCADAHWEKHLCNE